MKDNKKTLLIISISFICGNFLNKNVIIKLFDFILIHSEFVIGSLLTFLINVELVIKKYLKTTEEITETFLYKISIMMMGMIFGLIISYFFALNKYINLGSL